MEGEPEKGHAEGWTQPPQQLSHAKPQKEQNSCKQSQAMSQVLMKRLLEIFFLNSFQNLSSGLWSWNWREPFLFFLIVTAALASKHLYYLEISGYLCGCCYQK